MAHPRNIHPSTLHDGRGDLVVAKRTRQHRERKGRPGVDECEKFHCVGVCECEYRFAGYYGKEGEYAVCDDWCVGLDDTFLFCA